MRSNLFCDMFIQHWKKKKPDSLREKSARRAIQEEASNGNAKIGKLRYQNYSCRLRRLGYRRGRRGGWLGGGGGWGGRCRGSSFVPTCGALDVYIPPPPPGASPRTRNP